MAKRYDILRLPPQDKPIYFIMASRGDDDAEGKQYLYEEHVCPSDLFHHLEEVIVEGDSDRHGLLEYVRTVEIPFLDPPPDSPPGSGYDPTVEWPKIVPEAFD